MGKAAKLLVEKLSTSEVINQKPHGGGKHPPPVLLGLSLSIDDCTVIDAKEFHKLQTLYLKLMTHVRNIDRKMKVQTEENFQKTIMDEIVNLKKALEQK